MTKFPPYYDSEFDRELTERAPFPVTGEPVRRLTPTPKSSKNMRKPKSPKNKRKSLHDLFKLLSERLCAELLPPRPQRPRTTAEALDNLAAGKPTDPRSEWDKRRKELESEIELCRYVSEPSESNPVPWQIEALQEDLRKMFKDDFEDDDDYVSYSHVSEDDAIRFLLAQGGMVGWELDREVWQHITNEWDQRLLQGFKAGFDAASRAKSGIKSVYDRQFARSINKLKILLREKYELPAGKAEDLIAEALGTSGNTLRQRLQRAR
jgi:hypothetical protein